MTEHCVVFRATSCTVHYTSSDNFQVRGPSLDALLKRHSPLCTKGRKSSYCGLQQTATFLPGGRGFTALDTELFTSCSSPQLAALVMCARIISLRAPLLCHPSHFTRTRFGGTPEPLLDLLLAESVLITGCTKSVLLVQ